MSGAVVAFTDDELVLLHRGLAHLENGAADALRGRLDEAGRFAEQEGITVVACDNQNGGVARRLIWNDVLYLAAGSAWVDGVVVHHERDGTKTFVVTFKGIKS